MKKIELTLKHKIRLFVGIDGQCPETYKYYYNPLGKRIKTKFACKIDFYILSPILRFIFQDKPRDWIKK